MGNYCTTFVSDGKCSNCGAPVEATHKYCHECGRRLHPIEKKISQEEKKERYFKVMRRWLDGPTQKEIAREFDMSQSNVNIICRYVVGKMRFADVPTDIRTRIEEMLGRKVDDHEKVNSYYEQLKVIRKL